MKIVALILLGMLSACGNKDSQTETSQNKEPVKPRTRADVCTALADPMALAGAKCGEAAGLGKKEDLFHQGKKMFYEACCTGAECQEPAKRSQAEVDECLKALANVDCSSPNPLPKVCLDINADKRTSEGK